MAPWARFTIEVPEEDRDEEELERICERLEEELSQLVDKHRKTEGISIDLRDGF